MLTSRESARSSTDSGVGPIRLCCLVPETYPPPSPSGLTWLLCEVDADQAAKIKEVEVLSGTAFLLCFPSADRVWGSFVDLPASRKDRRAGAYERLWENAPASQRCMEKTISKDDFENFRRPYTTIRRDINPARNEMTEPWKRKGTEYRRKEYRTHPSAKASPQCRANVAGTRVEAARESRVQSSRPG